MQKSWVQILLAYLGIAIGVAFLAALTVGSWAGWIVGLIVGIPVLVIGTLIAYRIAMGYRDF